MMGYVSARRRAEDFAAVIDGSTPLDPHADMRAFLAIVEQLRGLEQPRLRDDFSADLRSQLMTEAPTALTTAEPDSDRTLVPSAPFDPSTSRRRRAASVAAVVCVTLGSGAGVAAASQSALPGDTLYPLKRGLERIQVATAGSSLDRGEQYLDNAGTRLSEVETLVLTRIDDQTTPTLIDKALEDFTDAADAGSGELVESYQTDQDETGIVVLREFTDVSAARLDDLLRSLPPELRDDVVAAAQDLATLDAAALQLCPTCGALAPLQLSLAMTTGDQVEGLSAQQIRRPDSLDTSKTPAPRGERTPLSRASLDELLELAAGGIERLRAVQCEATGAAAS